MLRTTCKFESVLQILPVGWKRQCTGVCPALGILPRHSRVVLNLRKLCEKQLLQTCFKTRYDTRVNTDDKRCLNIARFKRKLREMHLWTNERLGIRTIETGIYPRNNFESLSWNLLWARDTAIVFTRPVDTRHSAATWQLWTDWTVCALKPCLRLGARICNSFAHSHFCVKSLSVLEREDSTADGGHGFEFCRFNYVFRRNLF